MHVYFNVELLWFWLLWTLEQGWLYLGHRLTWKWNWKTDVVINSCLMGALLTYTEGYNAQQWKCPSKSTHIDAFTYAWNWFTFSGTSNERLCRICHEAEDDEELVSPCYCSGSVGLLHLTCLERWLGTSKLTRCEICKYEFTLKRLPRALTEVNRFFFSFSLLKGDPEQRSTTRGGGGGGGGGGRKEKKKSTTGPYHWKRKENILAAFFF